MDKFATLQEIIWNFCISWKLVRDILRHHRIDCYKQNHEIYIHIKEFYDVYTAKYNPALFKVEAEVEEIQKPTIEDKINRTFFSIFSEPANCKQKLRNLVMAYDG